MIKRGIFNKGENCEKLNQIFLMILSTYFLLRIIELSTLPFNRLYLNILRVLSLMFIVLKYYFQESSKTSFKRDSVLYFFSLLFSLVIWYKSDSFIVVDILIYSIGSKNVKFDNIIKSFLFTSITTVFIITILSLFGIIDNLEFIRGTRARYALGFYYPTDYVAMIFYISICLTYAFLKYSLLKHWKYLLYIILAVITYLLCDSRLGSLCILLLIPICMYVEKRDVKNIKKTEQFILTYSFSLFYALTIITILFSIISPYNFVIEMLDKLLSYRIYLSKIGILNYGFSLFGQSITMIGTQLSGDPSNYFYLDSSYVNITLRYGLFTIIGLLIMVTYINKRELKRCSILIPTLLLMIGINSLIGQQLIELAYNPFLLLLFSDNESNNNFIKSKEIQKMNLYYFSEKITTGRDAGNKARNDVERILNERYIALHPYMKNPNKNIIKSLYKLMTELHKTKRDDYIIIQYPLPMGYNKLLKTISLYRNVIIIVHDLTQLRVGNFSGKEENSLTHIKYIISHNYKMSAHLESYNIKKQALLNLNIFDYLTDNKVEKSHWDDEEQICFAGNLAKANFIYDLNDKVLDCGLSLYGINFDETKADTRIHYYGSFDSEEIHEKIKGKFGLIWDGDSHDTCTGNFGLYMKYNNPHKLSMYIAARMPVIVWNESAIAKYVKDNDIGIIVESLSDIPLYLKKITIDDYKKFERNIKKIQDNIVNGNSLKDKLVFIENRL